MTLAPEAARSSDRLSGLDQPATDGALRIGIGLDGLKLGGCQINALDLGRELRARGHSVTFFAVAGDPAAVHPSVLPLASAYDFDVELIPVEPTPAAQAPHLTAFARRHRLDVFHVFGSWLGEPAAIGLVPLPGTALVVLNWMMTHVPGSPPRSSLLLGTEELCRQARRPFGPDVQLFEPPIDTDHDVADPAGAATFRRRLDLSESDPLVVIVSRLDRDMKAEGVRDAIGAVGRLTGTGHRIELVIVGDGDAAAEIRKLAAQANAEAGRRIVTMTGSMQDPAVAYSAADLVLAMGGSAIRGLAFGKPVVVLGEAGFARACAPETIDYFFDRGYYGTGSADPDHARHLAGTIEAQFELARTTDLGAWGREVAVRRYSLQAQTTLLLTIYRRAGRRVNRRDRLIDGAYVRLRHRARSAKTVLGRARGRGWP